MKNENKNSKFYYFELWSILFTIFKFFGFNLGQKLMFISKDTNVSDRSFRILEFFFVIISFKIWSILCFPLCYAKLYFPITLLNKKSTITQKLRIAQKKTQKYKNSNQNIADLFISFTTIWTKKSNRFFLRGRGGLYILI